jgi:hypothetical protein
VLAPAFIGGDAPYRPLLELWVVDGYIVHAALHDPNKPIVPVADDLRRKLLDPPTGVRPRRLRLNDSAWAAELRQALPGIEVTSGPTPELDDPLEAFSAHMAQAQPASYLGDRLAADDMAALFTAADALYRIEPWQFVDDDQLVEVNIPELGVQGACLSVIGALGESFGILLFASLADYERMLAMADERDETGSTQVSDMVMTSLNYERGADLPKSLRQEVVRYGWPVAAPAAYPVVHYRDRDAIARGLTPHELHVITACVEALIAVLWQYRDAFATGGIPYFSLNHTDRRGVTVQLRSPPGGRSVATVATVATVEEPPTELEILDETLLVRLFEYAYARWGRRFSDRVSRLIAEEDEAPLMTRVGVYHLAVDDHPSVAASFLAAGDEVAALLDAPLRRLLLAQQSAWVSVWTVQQRVVGKGLVLGDLLTGETCWYPGHAGAEALPADCILLARVVRCDEEYLVNAHPVVLSFSDGAEVATRMLKYLRARLPVAVERLRQPNSARYLIKRWVEAVATIRQTTGKGSDAPARR